MDAAISTSGRPGNWANSAVPTSTDVLTLGDRILLISPLLPLQPAYVVLIFQASLP